MSQADLNNTTILTRESTTGDGRGRSPVTRRLAMNMFVSAAVAGTAIASLPAAAAEDDPIFAAIEAHRRAELALNDTIERAAIPHGKRKS